MATVSRLDQLSSQVAEVVYDIRLEHAMSSNSQLPITPHVVRTVT